VFAASTPPIVTTPITSPASVADGSVEKLLTIVFPVVLGVVVLVLVVLVIYMIYTRQCCQTTAPIDETVRYESGAERGKCLLSVLNSKAKCANSMLTLMFFQKNFH